MTHQFKVGQKYRLNEDWTHADDSFKKGSVHRVSSINEFGNGKIGDTRWFFNPDKLDYGTITLVKDVPTPRRHAEVIKAWAEDASLEVEVRFGCDDEWHSSPYPSWCSDNEYRIKPQKSEVDERIESLERELQQLKEARKNETK